MSIKDDLTTEMKELMRAKDTQNLKFNKAVRAALLEKEKEPGFSGEMSDEAAQVVIGAYQKKLAKALDQFGETDADYRAELQAEIAYCQKFLPDKLTEEEVAIAIAEIRAGGVDNDNMIMKEMMSKYKGRVDGKVVKQVLNS